MTHRLKHLPALDGQRGIAAMAVLLHHFFYKQSPIWDRLTFGSLGVKWFFVLSGFLITRILLADKAHQEGTYFRKFFWRRFLRIFPLYYLVLALYFLVFLPLSGDQQVHQFARQVGWYVSFYATNIGMLWIMPFHCKWMVLDHFWTLAVEEQFYLVWPFVVWWFRPRALLRVALGGIAVATAAKLWLIQSHFTPYAVRLPICQLESLSLGAILAIAERAKKLDFFGGTLTFLFRACGAALALFVIATPAMRHAILGSVNDLFIREIIAPLWFASLVGLGALGRLPQFQGRILRHLGRISYGLYVWHCIVMGALGYSLPREIIGIRWLDDVIWAWIYLVFTFLIAEASYFGFEQYFLRLKHRPPSIVEPDKPMPIELNAAG